MTPPSTAQLLSKTVLPEAQAFALPGSPVLTRSRSPAGPGATARTRKLSTRTFITLLDAMAPQPEPTMGSSPHEVPKLPQGSGLTLRSNAPLTQTKPSTGSAESQIALFSYRISHLTEHLKKNRKDYTTARSLTKLVGKRRALLDYLYDRDIERYRAIIKALGLRR